MHEVCGLETIIIQHDLVLEYNKKFNDLSKYDEQVPEKDKPNEPMYSQIHRVFERYS